MTIDVVINRNARPLRTDSALHRTLIAASTRARARIHETRTLDELDQVTREIATRGTRCVVVAGGDGSHMAGISALWRVYGDLLPPVALAPCGTVSTVARNFGVHGSARAWIERLVAAASAGTCRVERKATLRVCDDSGGKRLGFIFGTGLVSRFFDVYNDRPKQGLTTAALIAARVFVGSFVGSPLARRVLDPTRCTVRVDGALYPGRQWSLILASVVRDVGLHLLATYRADEALDRFHVVASGLPPHALGPQLPRVLTGRPLRGGPGIDTLATALLLSFDTPLGSYVLDGDVFHAQEASVETGPHLPLVVPL
jgi:diacylglycerol kinase family enzyme